MSTKTGRCLLSWLVAFLAIAVATPACSTEDAPGDEQEDGDGDEEEDEEGGENGETRPVSVSGVVRADGRLDGADVAVHVGEHVYTALSADGGRFTVEIPGEDARAFSDSDYVWVRAAGGSGGGGGGGGGDDSLDLVLVSHVGDWARVRDAVAGGEADTASENDLPRLVVDAFRTAEKGLIAQANGGERVRDWDLFQALAEEFEPGDAVVGASAILLVARGELSALLDVSAFANTEDFAMNPDAVWSLAAVASETFTDEAADLAGFARQILDDSHGARAGTYAEGDYEPAYVQALSASMERLSAGAWRPDPENAGRLRANGFDGAELHYEAGAAVFEYDGELSLATRSVYDGQVRAVTSTAIRDRMTLLSRGTRSDLVVLEQERRIAFDDGPDDDIREESAELLRLWRDDAPLAIDGDDLVGEWLVPYSPEHPILRERSVRSPDDLRLRLDEGGSGEVLAGGWHPGETVTWDVTDDTLYLEAAGDLLAVNLVAEPFAADMAQAHVEIDEGDGAAGRAGLVGPMFPAEFGSEWEEALVPGVYLLSDQRTPLGGFAIELDEDHGGALLDYHVEQDAWVEFAEVGWSLEDGELVIRRCRERGEPWRGLTAEPGDDECAQGYDRRTRELALFEEGAATVVERRDWWVQNDIGSEDPDGVWTARSRYEGRYGSLDEIEIADE